ncbi:hypothetical protein PRIPAC_75474 [Pristionchus pacificus]|uniref:Uncharacterized protein n=1 Tax=Pristionchus pacificus TaxID=54126 RepID=A0A2A6C6T4_PRIPA|nr:hypothetical protein PRIPAC_75474 [Pristionchus pacificus]|eukprot:PDM73763.1 hypothetical protein PRIPAC_41119 [Pristionchus pacificus]
MSEPESSDFMSQTHETDSQWIRRMAVDSSASSQSQPSSDALSQRSSSTESLHCPVTGRRRKRGRLSGSLGKKAKACEDQDGRNRMEVEEEGSDEDQGDKENRRSARLLDDRTLPEQTTGSDIDEIVEVDGREEEHLDSSQLQQPQDDPLMGEEEMEVAEDVEVVAESNDEEEEEEGAETTVIVNPDNSGAVESPASPPAAAAATAAPATIATPVEPLAAADSNAADAAAAAPPTEQREEGEVQPGDSGEEEQSQASLVLVVKTEEKEPEADEPPPRMPQLQHELAVRLNTTYDMTMEARAIVRAQFDLLLGLTTPQTPIEEWRQLMAAYAASEEEKTAGDEQVDTEYPREDMTDDERRAAHRKLARMVITRKMQQEMRNLEQMHARANSGQVDRESE